MTVAELRKKTSIEKGAMAAKLRKLKLKADADRGQSSEYRTPVIQSLPPPAATP